MRTAMLMSSHHPGRRAAACELVAALRAAADAMASAADSLQQAVPPEAAPEPAPPRPGDGLWLMGHLMHAEGMRIMAAADALVQRLLAAAAETPGGDRRLQHAADVALTAVDARFQQQEAGNRGRRAQQRGRDGARSRNRSSGRT